MTRSLTLAELRRADEISKPHHYKQKVQKTKDILKTWVLTGKQFEDFRQKNEQKHHSQPFKNTQWNTRPLNATIESGPGTHAEEN